jgi:PQQ-dependent catabolism-associated beta-propeller protein
MAHFIDTATHEITDNVLVDARPRFAEFSPDGSQVWVSSEISGTVSVIDNATRQVVHTIGFEVAGVQAEAIQPVGVRLTRDGRHAFVALGPANRVAVIDQKTYEVLDYLLVGQRVWQLAFNGNQSRLYTTNGVSNDISVIDTAKLEVIKSITVGDQPWGVAVTP